MTFVGAFSVIVQPVVEPMEHYTALHVSDKCNTRDCRPGQLGDTGIIVLQECGPLKKKGCECDDKEKEDERPKVDIRHLQQYSIPNKQ